MTRAALILALLASGCAASQSAPISYGASAGVGRQAAPPRRVQTDAGRQDARQEEQSGPPRAHPEAHPDWAAGPGTPLSQYALQPEDAQPFDPAHLPRIHHVNGDESLYDIATRYQIPLRALIDQNHLEPPYALARGHDLELPPPRMHRVARAETFEDVARAYNVDLRSLALLNRMSAPYGVREGDRVVLPAMARARTAEPAPLQTPSTAPVRAAGQSTRQTNPRLPNTPSVPTTTAPVGTAHFGWPLHGDVVARFGAQPGGGRLDGIEIAAAEGAAINAADGGEVVYAGSDLQAYGTLVLIRHENGYVTAYGYARRALVQAGQHVRAGQHIADVGRVGSGQPRLLFQVRRGSEAIDPTPLLGS